jgi:hypothetical protein
VPDDSLNLLGRWQLPERVGGLGTTDDSALDRSALRVCASCRRDRRAPVVAGSASDDALNQPPGTGALTEQLALREFHVVAGEHSFPGCEPHLSQCEKRPEGLDDHT